MKITKDNYELYALDYIEGTLSPELREEMEAFLCLHPEVRDELEDVSEVELDMPAFDFDMKASLKKDREFEEEEIDELAITEMEGVASSEEESQIAWLKSNSQVFNTEVEAYRQTVLTPEEITFPHKEELKKKDDKKVVPLWFRRDVWVGIAASLLLLVWLNINNDGPGENGKGIVVTLPKKETKDSSRVQETPKEVIVQSEKVEKIAPIESKEETISIERPISKEKIPYPEEEKLIADASVSTEGASEKIELIRFERDIRLSEEAKELSFSERLNRNLVVTETQEEIPTLTQFVRKKVRDKIGSEEEDKIKTKEWVQLGLAAMNDVDQLPVKVEKSEEKGLEIALFSKE